MHSSLYSMFPLKLSIQAKWQPHLSLTKLVFAPQFTVYFVVEQTLFIMRTYVLQSNFWLNIFFFSSRISIFLMSEIWLTPSPELFISFFFNVWVTHLISQSLMVVVSPYEDTPPPQLFLHSNSQEKQILRNEQSEHLPPHISSTACSASNIIIIAAWWRRLPDDGLPGSLKYLVMHSWRDYGKPFAISGLWKERLLYGQLENPNYKWSCDAS